LKKSLTIGQGDVNVNAMKNFIRKLIIKSEAYVSNELDYVTCKNS